MAWIDFSSLTRSFFVIDDSDKINVVSVCYVWGRNIGISSCFGLLVIFNIYNSLNGSVPKPTELYKSLFSMVRNFIMLPHKALLAKLSKNIASSVKKKKYIQNVELGLTLF